MNKFGRSRKECVLFTELIALYSTLVGAQFGWFAIRLMTTDLNNRGVTKEKQSAISMRQRSHEMESSRFSRYREFNEYML